MAGRAQRALPGQVAAAAAAPLPSPLRGEGRGGSTWHPPARPPLRGGRAGTPRFPDPDRTVMRVFDSVRVGNLTGVKWLVGDLGFYKKVCDVKHIYGD